MTIGLGAGWIVTATASSPPRVRLGSVASINDLAHEMPEKLAQMKETFSIEAARNSVYPVGGGLWILVYHPEMRVATPYREWDFAGNITRVPEFCAPGLGNRANKVLIDADIPADANGVLYALGGAGGGLTDGWEDAQGTLGSSGKRLILFAPDGPGWSDISSVWENVVHHPWQAGGGLSDVATARSSTPSGTPCDRAGFSSPGPAMDSAPPGDENVQTSTGAGERDLAPKSPAGGTSVEVSDASHDGVLGEVLNETAQEGDQEGLAPSRSVEAAWNPEYEEERLPAERAAAGLTQKQVMDRSGIPTSTYLCPWRRVSGSPAPRM